MNLFGVRTDDGRAEYVYVKDGSLHADRMQREGGREGEWRCDDGVSPPTTRCDHATQPVAQKSDTFHGAMTLNNGWQDGENARDCYKKVRKKAQRWYAEPYESP